MTKFILVGMLVLAACAMPTSVATPPLPAPVAQPMVDTAPVSQRVKHQKVKREAKPKQEAKKLPSRKQGACAAVPAVAYKHPAADVMAAAERMGISQEKLNVLRQCIHA